MRKLMGLLLLCGACGNGAISGSTAAAACVNLNACQLTGSISGCSNGIATASDPVLNGIFNGGARYSESQYNCVSNAGHSCVDVEKCLNNGTVPASCTGNGAIQCMGNQVIRCTDFGNNTKGTTTVDCSLTGETCVGSGSRLGCGIGTCSMDSTTCMGDVLQSCNNGILTNANCAHVGATCAITANVAHCRGKGPACTQKNNMPITALRCEGSTVVECLDGQEARYDCGQIGQGCFANVNQSGEFGCGLGADCGDGFTETCTGGVLTFCNNGKIDTYNCTGHGFSACDATNNRGCVI